MSTLVRSILVVLTLASASSIVFAHGGGLDSDGCHIKRATGEYHCHGGSRNSEGKHSAPSAQGPTYLMPNTSASHYDQTCHTGPRGGRYRIVNGKKRYGC